MIQNITLSVHQLVDFLLRTGDIDNRVFNNETMLEGTKIHAYYQSKQGNDYISEYYVKEIFKYKKYQITLEGRADGVIIDQNNNIVVDEIKSTISNLDDFFSNNELWHLGQAKCYAVMIMHEKKIDKIGIQLTYIHQIKKKKMIKHYSFTKNELELFINNLFEEYFNFYHFILKNIQNRNESAKKLIFPFENFRNGQRKLAKYTFGIAKRGGILFVEAPTGIGKTISTLFPYIKSFAETDNDKIFYLTAKDSGKIAAQDCMEILKNAGFKGKTIVISSKEKMCFCYGKACNPDECPYAKNYYNNLKTILLETIKSKKLFSKNDLRKIAKHYAICPFEFSLDLSLFCDIIICDYNYFFDPLVYLKRFFDVDASKSIILVDEAHNLVERSRSMYSSSIDLISFKKSKICIKNLEHKKIHNAEKKIAKVFNQFKDLENNQIISYLDEKSINSIQSYLLASQDVNKHHHQFVNDDFKQFSIELNRFIKLYEFLNETYSLFITKEYKNIKINLICLDPSRHLKNSISQVKSICFFSATFSPTNYYMDVIGNNKNAPLLKLPSPFPKENLCLMVAPNVSIKYKNRSKTILIVKNYIQSVINNKTGNYFIYVPSYEYLNQLAPLLKDNNFDLFIQKKDMTEDEKNLFISKFEQKPSKTTIGLAVLGGAFSEGIDLVSDRLIGVVVVGVGLPQLSFERNLISEYYENNDEIDGFDYAYTNPGMNKVTQAVGRLIRSENDLGVALLIDDRFLTSKYRDLYKDEWNSYEIVTSEEDINKRLKQFWKNHKIT